MLETILNCSGQRMGPFQCPSLHQVAKSLCGMEHANTNLPLHEISLVHRAIVQVIKLPRFSSSTRNWKWKKNNVTSNQSCHFGIHHLHQPHPLRPSPTHPFPPTPWLMSSTSLFWYWESSIRDGTSSSFLCTMEISRFFRAWTHTQYAKKASNLS